MTFQYRYGWAFPAVDRFMSSQISEDGTYQVSHYRMAMEAVRCRTLAVDGGAHVGTWSRLMSADFDRVIAVEPSADTFAALTENMRTFACTNVELRQVALGAKPGHVSMVLDGRAATLHNTGARRVVPGPDVPCETIDSWNLPRLGFLKLDVEGSEPFVLEGARATLLRCRPVVLFEDKGLWKQYGQLRDAPHRLLASLGYVKVGRAHMDEIWRHPKGTLA
jgi:FkbM family methyltransferase